MWLSKPNISFDTSKIATCRSTPGEGGSLGCCGIGTRPTKARASTGSHVTSALTRTEVGHAVATSALARFSVFDVCLLTSLGPA